MDFDLGGNSVDPDVRRNLGLLQYVKVNLDVRGNSANFDVKWNSADPVVRGDSVDTDLKRELWGV